MEHFALYVLGKRSCGDIFAGVSFFIFTLGVGSEGASFFTAAPALQPSATSLLSAF